MKQTTAFLIFLVLAAVLFVVVKAMHFNGLYGQDAHEYYRYARELHDNFATAKAPPYFAPLYPLLGASFGYVVGTLNALQLISIGSFAGTLWLIYLAVEKLNPGSKYSLPFVVGFGFLSPYFLRLSLCVMSDPLAIFLLTGTFYLALRFYQTNQWKYLGLAVLLAALTILTRYGAVIPLAGLFLALLVIKGRVLLHQPIRLSIAVTIILLLGVGFYYSPLSSQALHHPLFGELSLANFFKHSFSGTDGIQTYKLPNCLFLLQPFVHPGFIIVGIVLLCFVRKPDVLRKELLLAFIPVIGYLLFLSLLPAQNTRLQTLVFPLVLIFYFSAFNRVMVYVSKWPSLRFAFPVAILIIQLPLIVMAAKPIYVTNQVEREIAADLKSREKAFHVIYELGSDGIVQSYGIALKPVSLYGDTLTIVADSALLLIQPSAFQKQWQGTLPQQNLAFIQKNDNLIELKRFSNDWVLYIVVRK